MGSSLIPENVAVPLSEVTTLPTHVASAGQIIIRMSVSSLPEDTVGQLKIRISVSPETPNFDSIIVKEPAKLTLHPIPLRLNEATKHLVSRLLAGKVESFFDEDRHVHTLLNFGDDYQIPITNWMYDPTDPTRNSILVKLYRPLPFEIETKAKLWISRELANPSIDTIRAEYIPAAALKVYLRPPNRSVNVLNNDGHVVDNVTLSSLLSSSFFDVVKPTDRVVEEWYTDDINAAELNVDYSDFRNFVFYGSAKKRIDAFLNKLRLIEDYNTDLGQYSSSLNGTGSAYITGSPTYPTIQKMAEDRMNLLRSFDGYERFLYYTSGSAYSSSLITSDYEDELYYLADATYPKTNGVPYLVASASTWISEIGTIAEEYDDRNQNSLVNTLPAYVKEDDDSDEFITFMHFIGHHLDTIKGYIDAMPDIFHRGSDPADGLSPDMVWNVAKAFGVELPNQYAIKELIDYTIGSASVSPTVYRSLATETWKRFLHNQIFLMKTKGTKTALRTLMNVYGVLPTTLQIRESATPGINYSSSQFETIEEYTNTLHMTPGASLTYPWTNFRPMSMEMRFSTTQSAQSMLVRGDTQWSVQYEPLTGSYARLVVYAGITPVLSSSYLKMASGDFYTFMLRPSGALYELLVKRADNGDIAETSHTVEVSASTATRWANTTNVFIGSTASFVAPAVPFAGNYDEIRFWSESLSNSVFDYHVRYPGLYHGNSPSSSVNTLQVRLSFNKPKNLGTSSLVDRYVFNESPMVGSSSAAVPAAAQFISASGFSDLTTYPYNMSIQTREIQRYGWNAGGNQYVTNKVVVMPPATLRYVSGSIPVLRHDRSIVDLTDQREKGVATNTIGFFFSLTDAINDSIVRSLGGVNLESLIGDPADLYEDTYSDLKVLNDLYWTYYSYDYDVNEFVDFVNNLLGPMFKQAKKLVPARAKLLTGIVHEPHLLERSKIKHTPVSFQGAGARDQTDTHNLFAAVSESSDPNTSGDTGHYVGVTDVDETTDVIGTYPTNVGRISTSGSTQVFGSLPYYSSSITTEDSYTVACLYPTYDELSNLLAFKEELLARFNVTTDAQLSPSQLATYKSDLLKFKASNVISIVNDVITPASSYLTSSFSLTTEIKPYSDFEQLESRMYFTTFGGLYGEPTIGYSRVNNAILRERGTWTLGTAYSRNDVITQIGQSGSAAPGDDIEFVCITTDSPFISNLAPYLDTKNWKAATYIPVFERRMRKAIDYSGSVSLAPVSSSYAAARGYFPQHFKFTRDKRQGIINHQWVGCLQTDSTTIDGKPPVEIIIGSGDVLIVNNPTDPVQPVDDFEGPILDVT